MASWQTVTQGLEQGGYVAWEAAVDAATGQTLRDHVPVFAELQPAGQIGTLAQAIAATLALTDLRLSQHERDLLVTEAAQAGQGWPHEVRVVAFWPRAKLGELPAFWSVVQVGPPLAMPPARTQDLDRDLCATDGDLDPAVPLVGVIDDGIGFLNARFRHDRAHTRIHGVWLQAPERVDHGTPLGDVVCGQVLTGTDINAHLAAGGDEAEVYAQVNRALLPVTDGAQSNRHAAHGTHVLDLAAGATPWTDDPFRAVPILAVQLPPYSVRETAGRRMETYVVQGLRWILAEALRLSHGTDVPPVVVNLSLGSLAGPGDKHAFLANWFDHEIKRHARLGKGAKLRIVVAYGNARLSRLVARDEVRRSHETELIWRLQPDDHTSSHLELRVDAAMTPGLTLTLTPPPGSDLPPLTIDWPRDGAGWMLDGPRALVSSRQEAGGQSLVQLTLGPTVGSGALPACPPGPWRVTLHPGVAEPVRVTARVQRDETPFGYRTLGRQSWLDHPEGWDWDETLRGYLAPRAALDGPGCPITREGSCVAYAGAENPGVLFVGAARPVLGRPGEMVAASYSSEGVRHLARPGESEGPSLVARGDDGVMLGGKRAAGVVSGAVARMAGTSMAAPQVTRALLAYFQKTPPDEQSLDGERTALTGQADWTGTPDRRMGHGALVG